VPADTKPTPVHYKPNSAMKTWHSLLLLILLSAQRALNLGMDEKLLPFQSQS
jgi:hypothetical protein